MDFHLVIARGMLMAMPDILLGPGEDDDETAPPPHFSDPTSILEVEDDDDEGDE